MYSVLRDRKPRRMGRPFDVKEQMMVYKEVVYYNNDCSRQLSIAPSVNDGAIIIEAGDGDCSYAVELDGEAIRDFISTLTAMFINTKDK